VKRARRKRRALFVQGPSFRRPGGRPVARGGAGERRRPAEHRGIPRDVSEE